MKESGRNLWKQSRFLTVSYVVVWSIVLLLPLHAFLSTWLGTSIGPLWLFKSWKEIVLFSLALLGIVWVLVSAERRRQIFGDRLLQLIGLYALVTLAVTCFHARDIGFGAMWAGIAMNLRFPLMLAVTYIIGKYLRFDYGTVRHRVLHGLMWVGLGLAVLGILQVFVVDKNMLTQFGYDKSATIAPYVVIDDNPTALRAFATLRGPNDYGAFLILPTLVVVILGVLQRRRYLLILPVLLIAIVLSGSRSAWLGLLIGVAVMGIIIFGRHVLKNRKVMWAAVGGFAVGLLLVVASLSIPAVRLAIFHSSPGDHSLTEGSTDNHWRATWAGLQRVAHNPLGGGAGSSGPASYYGDHPKISENYYVQIAEETGVLGLAVFTAIMALVARRLYTLRPDTLAVTLLSAGAGVSAIGFWLHVWSDDPLALTYAMLVGIVLGVAARAPLGKAAKIS